MGMGKVLVGVGLFVALGWGNGGVAAAVEPSPVVIRDWNVQALSTVRATSASDAQAARLYAMVNAAMYDAVNGIDTVLGLPGRGHALVTPGGAPPLGDRVAAAAAAAHAVLSSLFPARAAIYDTQLITSTIGIPLVNLNPGRSWGASVGSQIVALRANDGSSPVSTQAASSGPGQFRTSWSGVQFRALAPFAIRNPAIYLGAGPPDMTRPDYAMAFAEVKTAGNAAPADAAKLATFQYWSLGSGTSQPPGAWVQVAMAVTTTVPQTLSNTARLYTLLTLAMVDTVAPTYETKFTHRFWRPTTAIQEAESDGNARTTQDATWGARAGSVGGTPEHWSGHSSFSAAAAEALSGFFCKNAFTFTLTTDSAPRGQARTYRSFAEAAREAGRSRVVGGLHFEFSNRLGLQAGRAIAAEVLASKLLRTSGPTHHGACPL
jgi:hypothetical protein